MPYTRATKYENQQYFMSFRETLPIYNIFSNSSRFADARNYILDLHLSRYSTD